MNNTPPSSPEQASTGASCSIPSPGPADAPTAASASPLGGGCCVGQDGRLTEAAEISHSARRARAVAGLGFLVAAGALSTRQLPGRVALWPLALVPSWFGISHLVASVTGYQGCPELGAIPSVMLARPVATNCGLWERIDRRLASL